MVNFDGLKKSANDWQATSYGDIAALAGLGGRLMHFKFYSPSLQKSLHTVLVEAGVGTELKVDFSFLKVLGNALTNCGKAGDLVTANSSFKNLLCARAFSRWDIMGAQSVATEASIASIVAIKASALTVYNNGRWLFDIPAEVSPGLGIGGGTSITGGTFIGIGAEVSDPYLLDRYNREKARRPTDPLVRPAGGF